MKITLLVLISVAILSCSGKMSENKHKTINKNKDELPEFNFKKEAHDFGTIKSGERLIYSFLFTNEGNSELVINSAKTDCSCINVIFPQKAISPGEKGIVEVEFNSVGMYGKQLKTVELQSNCKEPKHLVIFAQVENEQIEFKY